MLIRRSIAGSRPLMLQQLMADATRMELAKGSAQLTSPTPVALEPPFNPIRSARSVVEGISPQSAPWIEEAPASLNSLRRLQVYLAPDQDTRWQIAEAFPRQLQGVRHRVGFEIVGNRNGIAIWLCCHSDDSGVVQIAFEGTFDHSRLRYTAPAPWVSRPLSAWRYAEVSELVAPAAYLHAMPPAISGRGGHKTTYAAATALVHGFGLSDAQALSLLMAHYNPRCQPEWSESELRHKVADACSKPHLKPFGWLRDTSCQPQGVGHPANSAGHRRFAL